jgi:ribosome-binding protein aMBF1 (putative translation factor)
MQAAKAVEAGPMPTAQQLAAALAEAEGRPLNAGQPARRAQKPTLSVEERKRKKKEAAEKIDQRLFDARASLGMSRRELAAAIGMEFSRYAAYESGKRASVPGEVYESVELLLENSATSVRRANEIKGMSMSEVVQLWQKILGGCSVAELQDAICVSPRTMRRWRLDLYTPRHNIVVSYHSKVYEIAGMRKVKNNVKSIDS